MFYCPLPKVNFSILFLSFLFSTLDANGCRVEWARGISPQASHRIERDNSLSTSLPRILRELMKFKYMRYFSKIQDAIGKTGAEIKCRTLKNINSCCQYSAFRVANNQATATPFNTVSCSVAFDRLFPLPDTSSVIYLRSTPIPMPVLLVA